MRRIRKVLGHRIGEFEGQQKTVYPDDRKDIGIKPVPEWIKQKEKLEKLFYK